MMTTMAVVTMMVMIHDAGDCTVVMITMIKMSNERNVYVSNNYTVLLTGRFLSPHALLTNWVQAAETQGNNTSDSAQDKQ